LSDDTSNEPEDFETDDEGTEFVAPKGRFDIPLPDPLGAMPSDTKAGFVALIGAPNAGKSTLINQLVGTKVSIVTHKVQTTRSIVRGVAMHGTAQMVFIDTPGIFKPKRRLDRAMVDTAWGGARDADVIALLIDARKGIDEEVESDPQAPQGSIGTKGADPEQDRCCQSGKAVEDCASGQ
jgi:GTP-binding protein Era